MNPDIGTMTDHIEDLMVELSETREKQERFRRMAMHTLICWDQECHVCLKIRIELGVKI